MGIRKIYEVKCEECGAEYRSRGASKKHAAREARMAGFTVSREGICLCPVQQCVRARSLKGLERGVKPVPAEEKRTELLTFKDGSQIQVPASMRKEAPDAYRNACEQACLREFRENTNERGTK